MIQQSSVPDTMYNTFLSEEPVAAKNQMLHPRTEYERVENVPIKLISASPKQMEVPWNCFRRLSSTMQAMESR